MARVNNLGYVERTTGAGKNPKCKSTSRDWYLIKYGGTRSKNGNLVIGSIVFPEQYVGKRIRLKIEVLEDE